MASKIIKRIRLREQCLEAKREAAEALAEFNREAKEQAERDEERRTAKAVLVGITAVVGLAAVLSKRKKKWWEF